MLPLATSGYTAAQADAALHAAVRTWAFKYDLLYEGLTFAKALTSVLACSISNDVSAQVRRTATLTIEDDPSIDLLTQRVRPWARLKMPDGGYAEFPMGTFILSTPPRQLVGTSIQRTIQCYDLNQSLIQSKLGARLTIAPSTAGLPAPSYLLTTPVTTVVKTLILTAGIGQVNVVPSVAVLPAARDWPPGTTFLQVVNDLLKAILYKPLWFDAYGVAMGQPYVEPYQAPIEYAYNDDTGSLLLPQGSETLDLFNVPNQFIGIVSAANRAVLTSIFTNNDPASPVSTVNRGHTLIDFITSTAVDQPTLDAEVKKAAVEASQVYQSVQFATGLMPMHADLDSMRLNFSRLGVSDVYQETNWSVDLKPGATMSHTARKVVKLLVV